MEFRLLGPLEVRAQDGVLELPAGKPRALLALLLLEPGRVVGVERLVDGLWGERPPASAGKLVQGYVSQLRRALGSDLVRTRPPGYLVPLEQAEVDLRRFETLLGEARAARPEQTVALLAEALALWRGPPLPELSGSDLAQPEIARLEGLRLAALEERAEAELALGRHEQLVPELERLLAQEPFRERVRGQLMLALYRSGRQADALEVFRAGRTLMIDELGLEPGHELHELERQILAQDAAIAPAPRTKATLPHGTVTFVFTDVEGSTRLLHELGADEYARALAHHRTSVREAFAARAGVEVDTQGDAFFYAFARATDALAAAADAQHALQDGPLQARIGVHTGEPLVTDDGYVGVDVHRAARIAAAGHAGQTLVSQTTRDLAPDTDLRDLGEHRLKDLTRPERIYQLGDADFAALNSLNRTNLPVASWPLIGRETELGEIAELLADGVRLLTLTGAGGSGKTRLALQAAAERVDDFVDGVFFVPLAALSDAALVPTTVAGAVGLRADEDVFDGLRNRRLLLVLDNAEHLDGVAEFVANLLDAARDVTLVVTSRARLSLSAERELAVDGLANDAAAALFVERAAAVGRRVRLDDDVRTICARLDNLPLAVELAAARTKLLSPHGLLARLDRTLPLLTGGSRDVPERQRTLRATIRWSYALLSAEAQTVFRRLSVFRGSFAVDAAEAVAGADLDALTSLVDISLLKPIGDDRFLMLETLREFAFEQLAAAQETETTAMRHGCWYRDILIGVTERIHGPHNDELLRWYDLEAANLWAALDELLLVDPDDALSLATDLGLIWATRGAVREGRRWLADALERDTPESSASLRARWRLGDLTSRLGDLEEAEQILLDVAERARRANERETVVHALHHLGWVWVQRGELHRAADCGRETLALAKQTGQPFLIAIARTAVGAPLIGLRQYDEAKQLIEENLAFFESTGDDLNIAPAHLNLSFLAMQREDFVRARDHIASALRHIRKFEDNPLTAAALLQLSVLDLAEGHLRDALDGCVHVLQHARATGDRRSAFTSLIGIGLATREAELDAAARVWLAGLSHCESFGYDLEPLWREQCERAATELGTAIGAARADEIAGESRLLSEDESVTLALELARRGDARAG